MIKSLGKLAGLRIAPAQRLDILSHDPRVDALRGFAACSVVAGHLLATNAEINTSMNPPSEVLSYLHFSRAAVLLFFLLSGYVIGLVYRSAPTPALIGDYIKRRALRILPIFLLGLIGGYLAIPESNPVKLAANLLFLHNTAWGLDPLYGNFPLWSLHYEVVYYAGFIWLWLSQPRALPLFVAFIVLALADWFYGGILSVFGGWSVGACFWIAGLLIAWRAVHVEARPALGLLLATYATNHLWPANLLLNGLGFPYAGRASIHLSDLILLPGCLSLFCTFVGLQFRGLALLRSVTFLIPAGTVVLLVLLGRLGDALSWQMSAIATGLSLLCLPFEKTSWANALLRPFARLSPISYALYLFHMPILDFVSKLRRPESLDLSYGTALVLFLGLSFGLAYLAERQLQPWLVALYRSRQVQPTGHA